jgi:hypothetical protein
MLKLSIYAQGSRGIIVAVQSSENLFSSSGGAQEKKKERVKTIKIDGFLSFTPLNANVLFCRFFWNLILCMTKLGVLTLSFPDFTDNLYCILCMFAGPNSISYHLKLEISPNYIIYRSLYYYQLTCADLLTILDLLFPRINKRLCHERLCPENKVLYLMLYYELKLYWIKVCWLYENS